MAGFFVGLLLGLVVGLVVGYDLGHRSAVGAAKIALRHVQEIINDVDKQDTPKD